MNAKDVNAIITCPTAAGSPIISTNTASTMNTYTLAGGSVGRSRVVSSRSQKNIKSAVYAHIQAVRALGRTTINTVEISKALGLPLADIDRTVKLLKEKGVRVIG
jgi:hypothetical protein